MSDKEHAQTTAGALLGVLKSTAGQTVDTHSRLMALEVVTAVALHHLARHDPGLLASLQQIPSAPSLAKPEGAQADAAGRIEGHITRLVAIIAGKSPG